MKSNNLLRQSALGLTTGVATGVAMGVGGIATLATAQTAPGFTAIEGLAAPANVGQALTIQTATGAITVPASAYVVQNGVVLVNASTLTAIQAAGGLATGGLGISTAVASSTLAAVGGAGFLVLDTPEADPEPEPDPEPQPDPDTPGSISDGTTTVDLGIGFTVNSSTEDELYVPQSTFTVIGSGGDDTIGAPVEENIGGNPDGFDGSSPGNKVTINLTNGGMNNVAFGAGAAERHGVIEITGGAGNDTVSFGDGAAQETGSIEIDLSAGGTNSITFGDDAAQNGPADSNVANITITGGAGNDALDFGHDAASNNGAIIIAGGAGSNNARFGNNAAAYDGTIKIMGGSGVDIITFADGAAINGGSISIDLDDEGNAGGNNEVTFDAQAGTIQITGGDGDDKLNFGASAATDREAIVIDLAAGGDNDIDFANEAAAEGVIQITGGAGNDTVSFASSAAVSSGTIEITGGAGNDTVTFGTSAAQETGSITIDFGEGGTNSVTFGSGLATSAGSVAITGGGGQDSYTFNDITENVKITGFGTGGDTISWVTDELLAPVASVAGENVQLSGVGFSVTLVDISSTDDISIVRNDVNTAFSITG